LLSDQYREENRLFVEGEQRREMTVARKMGLDSYVFSYLGAHESYYGRDVANAKGAPRPIGIYLSPEVEKFPPHSASTRDAGANAIQSIDEKKQELVNCRDARILAAYQVSNHKEHGGQVEHYWGDPKLIDDPDYRENSWRKKIEFHHYERVLIADFAAVLWPVWKADVVAPGVHEMSETVGKMLELKADHNLIFIPYISDSRYSEKSFLQASIAVSRYFSKFGEYPADAASAMTTLKDD